MTLTNLEARSEDARGRAPAWRWYICVLLLLATVVNYMDRMTVNTLAKQIQTSFHINNEQYGQLERGFGLAFATGSLFFGFLVDRIGVYWLYPVVLIGWSVMGFLTGLSRSFNEVLVLRTLLGLFEAGHFPCGLKTIQVLLAPRDRALGNSLLQSGTALGAILAPQAIKLLMTEGPSGWRPPFLVIGAGGCTWVLLWLLSLRPSDLEPSESRSPITSNDITTKEAGPSFLHFVFSPQYFCLAVMVVCINLNWHLFRVWLPKFLPEARGYAFPDMLNFMTFYYLAADIGGLSAGALSGWLARKGLSVFSSRMWVFACCCLLTTATTAAAFLPAGPFLLLALLVVGFGGLGTFTAFYSLTQDLSREHQGKMSGSLAMITWVVTASLQPVFGRYLDRTGNYDGVVGAVGWLPAFALVTILLFWHVGQPSQAATKTRLPLDEATI